MTIYLFKENKFQWSNGEKKQDKSKLPSQKTVHWGRRKVYDWAIQIIKFLSVYEFNFQEGKKISKSFSKVLL